MSAKVDGKKVLNIVADGKNVDCVWKRSDGVDVLLYKKKRAVAVGKNTSFITRTGRDWKQGGRVQVAARSVCYGGGLFYAVGDSGRPCYTTDGTSWTQLDSDHSASLTMYCVCYGGGKFCAVGQSGKVLYSEDGETFKLTYVPTDKASYSTYNLYSVCYGNGKFVIRGVSSSYMTSFVTSDFSTWTHATSSNNDCRGLCYFNGFFIGVGNTTSPIRYSTDGITWASASGISNHSSGSYLRCVCHGGGVAVALGGNGNSYYSTDGINWTRSSGIDSEAVIYGVCHLDGMFIAVGPEVCYCSRDGKTWDAFEYGGFGYGIAPET